jgi:uncharacterized protein YkuJ
MKINKKTIRKLEEELNNKYNVVAHQNFLFSHLLTIVLKDTQLTIDTSKGSSFELKDDKLTFVRYSGKEETLELKDYKKRINKGDKAMSKKRLTKTDYLRRKELKSQIKHNESIEKIGSWKHKIHGSHFSILDLFNISQNPPRIKEVKARR